MSGDQIKIDFRKARKQSFKLFLYFWLSLFSIMLTISVAAHTLILAGVC